MLGNKTDALGVPTFNISIAFDTLWEHAGKPNLIGWELPHLTFLLCFTRFAKKLVNRVDPLELPIFTNSIVFYML